MTLQTVPDSGGSEQPPDAGSGGSAISRVLQAIGKLLAESPLAYEQFQEARHDQAEADQLDAEAMRASEEASDAGARVTAEQHKAGPHKRLNRRIGSVIAIALALADALPAYWSAAAFNLDQRSTLVLTVLLCAALGGAMWLLDLFSNSGNRRALRALEGTLVAGFAALFALRFNYLQVINGASAWSAAIQAFTLTALSAALVAVGFVILAHRMPKKMASAQNQARQIAHSGAKEAAANARKTAAMSRAALEDTVVAWALAHEPTDSGHEQFLKVISGAIDVLLKRKQEQSGQEPPKR